MTKSQIHKIFSFEPSKSLRSEIWNVMAKNRNKLISEVKFLKNVRPIEVVALKLRYGVELDEEELKLSSLPKYKDFLKQYN